MQAQTLRGPAIVGGALAAATLGWFFYLWLFSDAAWVHPEMLGSSAYVWLYPGQEGLPTMLRKVFDWKAFDPNVNRVRPLNDLFEVIDAIARPYLTSLFGPEVSLTPSTIFAVILAPGFLFGWARRILKASLPALVFTLLFVSTIGFLSNTVAYLHPAKRLNLVLLCASLYFAEVHAERQDRLSFAALWSTLLVSFFADELGLANFPIIAALYWVPLCRDRRRRALFLSLPIFFLAITKWGLPAIYLRFSVHGAWDAMDNIKKFAVFGYLLDPTFYSAAIEQTARSMLSTVGIETHLRVTEVAAWCALVGLTGAHAWRTALRSATSIVKDPVVMSAVAFVAASFYATLLDWYPFPHEISYLGSFNYYYHSSMPVLVIAWLAFLWREVAPPPQLATLALALAAAIIVANFTTFGRINRLVEFMHLQPYPTSALLAALKAARSSGSDSQSTVEIKADPVGQEAEFSSTLRQVFGSEWKANGFYTIFWSVLASRPLMQKDQIDLLFHAFYPWQRPAYTIVVQDGHR
jgi:hypothetical protein